MAWKVKYDPQRSPVAIIGAGVLGRRLAVMWASTGNDVQLMDFDANVLANAKTYFDEIAPTVTQAGCDHGNLILCRELPEAVKGVWLVIEVIPEKLQRKIDLFGQLDSLTEPSVILATNSSSFKSSEMISKVLHPERVLNVHAFMPPEHIPQEIMTCGYTDGDVIELMMYQGRLHGFKPYRVLKESSGFIYNRVWAAVKREALYSVAQGATTPEDLDDLFRTRLQTPQGPFQMMDAVGLDTVLDIEEHYAAERPGIPTEPRDLLKSYISKGKLGRKSGIGFYDYPEM